MSVIVTRYMDVEISCDESGLFEARAFDKYYSNRTMSGLKKEIRETLPSVVLMTINDRWFEVSNRHYSGVKIGEDGQYFTVEPPPSGRYEPRISRTSTLYEPDAAFIDAMRAIGKEEEVEKKRIEAESNAKKLALVATLVPITMERFSELIEAERIKRNRLLTGK